MTVTGTKEALVRIEKGGKIVFLHDDNLTSSLKNDGELFLERASDLKFDNSEQMWFVHYPGSPNRMIPVGFETRQQALDSEKALLESNL